MVYTGGIPLLVTNMVLAIVGMKEFYMSMFKKRLLICYLGYAFAIILYMIIDMEGTKGIMAICSLFLISLMMVLVFQFPKINIIDCAIAFFGFFYVALLISFVYQVRHYSYGRFFVWLIFICAFGCDTFAYFTGTLFGKHKLVPTLSPKKTVEGAVGGVLGAVILAYIYSVAVSKLFFLEDINIVLLCTIAGAAGAVFAQLGDLSASAIKRYTGIKDFGKIIPGHGGVLDRFDSVLFTAPAVYFVMLLLIK